MTGSDYGYFKSTATIGDSLSTSRGLSVSIWNIVSAISYCDAYWLGRLVEDPTDLPARLGADQGERLGNCGNGNSLSVATMYDDACIIMPGYRRNSLP